jgi:hypothetical protein
VTCEHTNVGFSCSVCLSAVCLSVAFSLRLFLSAFPASSSSGLVTWGRSSITSQERFEIVPAEAKDAPLAAVLQMETVPKLPSEYQDWRFGSGEYPAFQRTPAAVHRDPQTGCKLATSSNILVRWNICRRELFAFGVTVATRPCLWLWRHFCFFLPLSCFFDQESGRERDKQLLQVLRMADKLEQEQEAEAEEEEERGQKTVR